MIVFDYIFYRLYDFYCRKAKKEGPFFTAVMFFSFLQFLLLYCIFMFYSIFSQDAFGISAWMRDHRGLAKGLGVSIGLGLEVFNYLRYRKKETKRILKRRFGRLPLNKIIRPWMFLFLGVFLFLFPLLVPYLLKMIFQK